MNRDEVNELALASDMRGSEEDRYCAAEQQREWLEDEAMLKEYDRLLKEDKPFLERLKQAVPMFREFQDKVTKKIYKSRHDEMLSTAFDKAEDLHFDLLNDEEPF